MELNKPQHHLLNTWQDKASLALCVLLLAALWLGTIITYFQAPEIIPVHFGLNGQADDYGSKIDLFVNAGIGTLIYIFLSTRNKKQHGASVLRWIKAGMLVIHITLLLNTVAHIRHDTFNIGWVLGAEVICIVVLPYFLFKAYDKRRAS